MHFEGILCHREYLKVATTHQVGELSTTTQTLQSKMTAQGYGQQWNRGPNYHLQDYSSNWGYVIVYLIVILVSLLGNGLFLFTVKKNPRLKRTPHYMLASLALRDLIVSLLVVPFVIDSQVSHFFSISYRVLKENSLNL